jgi:hypothetical protein
MSALRWRQLLAAALVVTGAQALAAASNGRAQANGEVQARRVWVLSDPDGYASGSRQREIVVYDLTCEEGKMTRVSEGFEVASGPKFGEGWVIRTHGALSAAAEQEQLKRAFADVCGI